MSQGAAIARITEDMVEAGARAAFDVWWADRGDGYEYSWLCGKSAWKKQIRAALEAAAALSTESVPVAWLRRRDIDGPCNAIPAWKTQSDGADVAVYTAPISTEPGEADPFEHCATEAEAQAELVEQMRGVYPGDPHGALGRDANKMRRLAKSIRQLRPAAPLSEDTHHGR